MTRNQIKFLKSIYKKEKTAKQLCKELKIEYNKDDKVAGCYNALNNHIENLTSDYDNEISDMFEVMACDKLIANNDVYIITPKGKTYIENYKRELNRYVIGAILAVVGIIVTIVLA